MQVSTPQIITNLFTQASQVTLGLAVDAFIAAELSHRSQFTVQWYRQRLVRMANGLGMRALGECFEGDVLAYYASLEGLSAFTIHGHGRAIKRFWRWLHLRGLVSADLGALVRLPRLPRQGRKGISESNLTAILEAAQSSRRDFAILKFIESTGCRRAGAAGLLLDDLNLQAADERIRRRATVREKGEKSRSVAMDGECLEAIRAWLAVRPVCEDEHVFIGRKPGEDWHAISPAGVSGIIERYKRRLGLSGPCSPHQWRHRWARNRISRGMSLGDASRLLGHENIKVTNDFYGQFDFDTLQGVADRFSYPVR